MRTLKVLPLLQKPWYVFVTLTNSEGPHWENVHHPLTHWQQLTLQELFHKQLFSLRSWGSLPSIPCPTSSPGFRCLSHRLDFNVTSPPSPSQTSPGLVPVRPFSSFPFRWLRITLFSCLSPFSRLAKENSKEITLLADKNLTWKLLTSGLPGYYKDTQTMYFACMCLGKMLKESIGYRIEIVLEKWK